MIETPQIASADSNYILDRNDAESVRLTGQYDFIKALCCLEAAVPSNIDLSKASRILDIAAGNLVWILDVANHPDIRSRLPSETASESSIQLYACDLSSKQFPPSSVTKEIGITTFEHDVTIPFPKEYENYFDLIHMSMLVAALSETGWVKALQNIRKILHPEGKLYLFDINSIWIHPEEAPPINWKYEPSCKYDLDPSKWIDLVNSIAILTHTETNNFIPDLVYRLPHLLNSTSFKVISERSLVTPIGTLCKTRAGPQGQSLAHFSEFTSHSFFNIFDATTRNALKIGVLRSISGKIETEQERQRFMNIMKKGLDEEGALRVFIEIVAGKIQ